MGVLSSWLSWRSACLLTSSGLNRSADLMPREVVLEPRGPWISLLVESTGTMAEYFILRLLEYVRTIFHKHDWNVQIVESLPAPRIVDTDVSVFP